MSKTGTKPRIKAKACPAETPTMTAPVPTTPKVKITKTTPTSNDPQPATRMGATRVWNKVRPKKGVQGAGVKSISKIKNFEKLTKVPDIDYSDKTAHFAPKVPNTAAVRNGYTPPGKGTKHIRGGGTDTEGDAPAQSSYS